MELKWDSNWTQIGLNGDSNGTQVGLKSQLTQMLFFSPRGITHQKKTDTHFKTNPSNRWDNGEV